MKRSRIFFSIFIVSAIFMALQLPAQSLKNNQSSSVKNQKKEVSYKAYIIGQEINIEFTDEPIVDFSVELFNLTGKKTDEWKVQRVDSNKTYLLELDQVLANGIYIVKLIVGSQEIVKKIYIQ